MPSTPLVICEECHTRLPPGLSPLLCPVCLLAGAQPMPERRRIGSCIIEHEIARGGMGIVYRAVQQGLRRPVALKLLPAAALATASIRGRFHVESSAVAKLRHPGIVAIHEVGEHEGHPYFTMDFIEGAPLDEHLRNGPPPSRQAAEWARSLAESVSYAHSQNVSHRDLKPSNILIGNDQQPVLTDFGLARVWDDVAHLTLSGQVVGTPGYLPPERALGLPATAESDQAGDVYGLGAVLYHMLAGAPPFVGESAAQTLHAVVHQEPVSPHRLRPGVSRDLETICLKAIQKKPASRYVSAAAMAEDLRRFLEGRPILARPESAPSKFLRLARRHPVFSGLAVAFVLSAAIGVAATLHQSQLARDARAAAEELAEKRRAEVYAADVLAASLALTQGDLGHARTWLDRHLPASPDKDLRGFEWHYLNHQCGGTEHARLDAHPHIVTAIAWSPDGSGLVSADMVGTLVFWKFSPQENPPLREVRRFSHSAPIRKVEWLPDGKSLLLAGPDRQVRLIRAADGHRLQAWPGQCFSLSANGDLLAIADSGVFAYESSGPVKLYQLPSGKAGRTVADAGRAVALSPDGARLAIATPHPKYADLESGITIHDLQDAGRPPIRLATADPLWALCFSPDGRQLAAVSDQGGEVFRWESTTGAALPGLRGHRQRVWSCGFLENGTAMLTTGSDRSIRLWDTAKHAERHPTGLVGHEAEIWCATAHPGNEWLATGDKDGKILLWKWPPAVPTLRQYSANRYLPPMFTPDGQSICIPDPGGKEGVGTILQALDSSAAKTLTLPSSPIGISGDGEFLVPGHKRDTLEFHPPDLSAPTRHIDVPPPLFEAPLTHRGCSANGRHFYHIDPSTGQTLVIDLKSGTQRSSSKLPNEPWIASAISEDGQWLACASWHSLYLLHLPTGKWVRIPNDRHWANALAFHPDGKRLISAGIDGNLKIHAIPTLAEITTLRGHLENASGLALSPDGLTLASIEKQAGVRFWRLDTLREVVNLPIPNALEWLKFSPDGKFLAVSILMDDGRAGVRLIDAGSSGTQGLEAAE